MQEASPLSLIEEIVLIILIYYAIKFLAKLFLPVLAKKVVEKAGEQFRKQQEHQQQTNSTPPTGKRDISHETKKVGDYIDYEEVE